MYIQVKIGVFTKTKLGGKRIVFELPTTMPTFSQNDVMKHLFFMQSTLSTIYQQHLCMKYCIRKLRLLFFSLDIYPGEIYHNFCVNLCNKELHAIYQIRYASSSETGGNDDTCIICVCIFFINMRHYDVSVTLQTYAV